MPRMPIDLLVLSVRTASYCVFFEMYWLSVQLPIIISVFSGRASNQKGPMYQEECLAEIFEQVLIFSQELAANEERLSNVVFMGMGEPMANFKYA